MARGGSLKPRAARDFFIIEDEPTAEEDDACAVDFGLCTFCGVLPITQPEHSADESLDRAVMVVALPQSPEDPALDAYASDASAVVRRDSGPRIVRRLSSRPLLWQKAEAQEASEIGAEVAPQLSVVEQYLAWEGGRLAPERVAELRALPSRDGLRWWQVERRFELCDHAPPRRARVRGRDGVAAGRGGRRRRARARRRRDGPRRAVRRCRGAAAAALLGRHLAWRDKRLAGLERALEREPRRQGLRWWQWVERRWICHHRGASETAEAAPSGGAATTGSRLALSACGAAAARERPDARAKADLRVAVN